MMVAVDSSYIALLCSGTFVQFLVCSDFYHESIVEFFQILFMNLLDKNVIFILNSFNMVYHI